MVPLGFRREGVRIVLAKRDATVQHPKGYCVACKTTREMKDAKQVERAGGPAVEGKCSVCGAKMFILGSELPPENNGTPASQP